MKALIKNEIIKMIKSLMIPAAVIIAVIFSILLVNQKGNYLRDASNKDPKAIAENIKSIEEKLKDPGLTQAEITSYQDVIDRLTIAMDINQKKKDAYQAENQRPEIKEAQALEDRYLQEHKIEKESSYARNSFTILMNVLSSKEIIAIFFVAALLGSTILANEYQPATIKNLVTCAIPRWKLLLSKYITMVASVTLITVLFIASVFLYSLVIYGWGSADYPVSVGADYIFKGKSAAIYQEGSIYLVSRLLFTALTALHTIFVSIVTATVAFLLSVIITRKAFAVICSFLSMIVIYLSSLVFDAGSPAGLLNFMNYSALDPVWTGNLLSKTLGGNIPILFTMIILIIWLTISLAVSFGVFTRRDIRA